MRLLTGQLGQGGLGDRGSTGEQKRVALGAAQHIQRLTGVANGEVQRRAAALLAVVVLLIAKPGGNGLGDLVAGVSVLDWHHPAKQQLVGVGRVQQIALEPLHLE
ncbi:hypothetical protein D3C76_736800 [compost metagenome]